MKGWVEGLSGLQYPVGDMDEFTHHGANDEHGRLSGLTQARPEGATPGGFVEGDHCRHVEGLAQERVPHLGEPGFPMDAAPRELLARVKTKAAHWRALSKRVDSA